MRAKVVCLNKNEFQNKAQKTSYVLELIDFDHKHIYKAFTSKKHYEKIKPDFKTEYDGHLNFDNGFTHFYLPKSEVE